MPGWSVGCWESTAPHTCGTVWRVLGVVIVSIVALLLGGWLLVQYIKRRFPEFFERMQRLGGGGDNAVRPVTPGAGDGGAAQDGRGARHSLLTRGRRLGGCCCASYVGVWIGFLICMSLKERPELGHACDEGPGLAAIALLPMALLGTLVLNAAALVHCAHAFADSREKDHPGDPLAKAAKRGVKCAIGGGCMLWCVFGGGLLLTVGKVALGEPCPSRT